MAGTLSSGPLKAINSSASALSQLRWLPASACLVCAPLFRAAPTCPLHGRAPERSLLRAMVGAVTAGSITGGPHDELARSPVVPVGHPARHAAPAGLAMPHKKFWTVFRTHTHSPSQCRPFCQFIPSTGRPP
jgi:hypothetical protein